MTTGEAKQPTYEQLQQDLASAEADKARLTELADKWALDARDASERAEAAEARVRDYGAMLSQIAGYVMPYCRPPDTTADGVRKLEARLRAVTEERDAFREQLVGCFTVLGKAIERLPLNESAEIGIQRLSRDCAALLDRYPLSAACSADLPPHPDTEKKGGSHE